MSALFCSTNATQVLACHRWTAARKAFLRVSSVLLQNIYGMTTYSWRRFGNNFQWHLWKITIGEVWCKKKRLKFRIFFPYKKTEWILLDPHQKKEVGAFCWLLKATRGHTRWQDCLSILPGPATRSTIVWPTTAIISDWSLLVTWRLCVAEILVQKTGRFLLTFLKNRTCSNQKFMSYFAIFHPTQIQIQLPVLNSFNGSPHHLRSRAGCLISIWSIFMTDLFASIDGALILGIRIQDLH